MSISYTCTSRLAQPIQRMNYEQFHFVQSLNMFLPPSYSERTVLIGIRFHNSAGLYLHCLNLFSITTPLYERQGGRCEGQVTNQICPRLGNVTDHTFSNLNASVTASVKTFAPQLTEARCFEMRFQICNNNL